MFTLPTSKLIPSFTQPFIHPVHPLTAPPLSPHPQSNHRNSPLPSSLWPRPLPSPPPLALPPAPSAPLSVLSRVAMESTTRSCSTTRPRRMFMPLGILPSLVPRTTSTRSRPLDLTLLTLPATSRAPTSTRTPCVERPVSPR